MTRDQVYDAVLQYMVGESLLPISKELQQDVATDLSDRIWTLLHNNEESVEGLFNPDEDDGTMAVVLQDPKKYKLKAVVEDRYSKIFEVVATSPKEAINQLEEELRNGEGIETMGDTLEDSTQSIDIIHE